MTDAELLNAFSNFVNTSWMIFTAYVSIVFAYLVAGYLISNKLGSNMVFLVSTIYTFVAMWAIFAINTNLQSISATASEIRRVVQEGESTLGWLPIVDIPEFLDTAIPIIVTVITLGAYVGSIVFFFYQRNHSSDAGT